MIYEYIHFDGRMMQIVEEGNGAIIRHVKGKFATAFMSVPSVYEADCYLNEWGFAPVGVGYKQNEG